MSDTQRGEKVTSGACLLEQVVTGPGLCGVGSHCGVLNHRSIHVCELTKGHEGPHQATPPPFTWECSPRCPNHRLIGAD